MSLSAQGFLADNLSAKLPFGNQGNDYLDGEDGNDTLWGGFGNDKLLGDGFGRSPDDGNDILKGDSGDDIMLGNDVDILTRPKSAGILGYWRR